MVAEGTLAVPLTEGIAMTVELEVTEVREDGLWKIENRVIQKVLNVRPPIPQGKLFPDEGQKGQPGNDENNGSGPR